MLGRSQTARALIYNSAGEILLIERHKEGEHYFVLPGGQVDPGETPEQAVVREVQEETQFHTSVKKHLYTNVDKFGHHQFIFLCSGESDTPKLSPDSIETSLMAKGKQLWRPAWFDLKQLQDKTIYPSWLLSQFAADQRQEFINNPRTIDLV